MLRKLVAGLMCVVPGLAQAELREWDLFRIPVIAISATSFEVIENDGAGGEQLWCAAGKFARETLGAGPHARLYIIKGRGPSERAGGRTGIVFTTQEVDGAFTGYDLSVSRAGKSVGVAHANSLCHFPNLIRLQRL